ncbi:MFS transporter [Streptomyces millisiae]|uniref:MFS transporter n=1 Tax=Streptomyces millisiae TaxID=3075542 RepID=A0ABU2LHK4_9ACTN|nr:MFS transporter [Streptomyces sp. DSM 44918]MDT0317066.1 MFS transporter [Streptomyces sp. DSM 44918]
MSHGAGFWLIAAAFLTAMAFSTVPTPLWALYQRQDGLSTFTVTVVFAMYALGVVVSLFLAGHVSDWLGRRRVLLPAVLLEAASAALFLSSTSLPVLILARVVSGLGVGMITATATAHLAELHLTARPTTDRTRSDVVATAANLGGLAVGPLVSGLLAQYVADPLRTPYLVFLILLVLSAVGVALVPETVELAEERPPYRPQRVKVPAASRPLYLAAAAAALAAFSVLGLFTSLAPGFVAGTMHHPSRVLAGLVTFLVFGTAAATQVALTRLTARQQLASGLVLMSAGIVGITAAVWLPHLGLFLVAGVTTGAGAGTLFRGTVATVASVAPHRARGEALAGLFLAAYIGLAVPVVGVGLATRFVSDPVALLGFTAALLMMNTAVSTSLLRRR